MKTIHDAASEMDRLFPDQVDREPCDWGHGSMAGHIGHTTEVDGMQTIGWFCAGGSTGNPVLRIKREDVERAAEVLAALHAARGIGDVEDALTAAGITFSAAY